MGKTAYDGKRGPSTFMIPSHDLCVVGGDGPNDIPAAECPQLFKPDVRKPIPKAFVQDMRHGQHTPCKVKKDASGRMLVVFGNTRTRSIREIVTEDGTIGTPDEMLVECQFVVRGTTGKDAMEIGMSENGNRKIVNAVDTGRICQSYVQLHGDDPETLARCAMRNGMTVPRLKLLLDMMENAEPDVLAAMDEGNLGIESVMALAKLDPAEQRRQLAMAAETGTAITTSKARAAVRASKGKSIAPGKRELRAEWKELVEVEVQNDVLVSAPAMMAWLLGEGPKPTWSVVPKKATAEVAKRR